MMKQGFAIRQCLLALSFLLVSEAALAAAKDAFVAVDKKGFKKQVDYIALLPLESSSGLNLPDNARQIIEAELIKRLEKKGYKVLPSGAAGDIQQQMAAAVPITVDKDKKQAAVMDHSLRELLYRHPVDAVVRTRVMAVAAPFADDKAQWGGVSQKIKHKGDGLLKVLTGGGYQGTIAASALVLSIADRQDNRLYHWAGGIELMMWRNGKKLEYLPATELWQAEKRIKKAVKLALDPL